MKAAGKSMELESGKRIHVDSAASRVTTVSTSLKLSFPTESWNLFPSTVVEGQRHSQCETVSSGIWVPMGV